MTAVEIIANLEARGISLELDESCGFVIETNGPRPTPDDMVALRAEKDEIVDALRARQAAPATERPLPEPLEMPLHKLTNILVLDVPWCAQPVYIAPGCGVARRLARGHGHGRVWCVCEVLDLLFSRISPSDARKIAEGKLMFDGVTQCLPAGGVQ